MRRIVPSRLRILFLLAVGGGCAHAIPAPVVHQSAPPTPEAAAQLRELVAGGSMGVGVMTTDDCQQTYEQLLAKGVTFLAEPAERPYGIEATLRDDSGNMMSLVQPFPFDGAPA